jgi:hypothetical protein
VKKLIKSPGKEEQKERKNDQQVLSLTTWLHFLFFQTNLGHGRFRGLLCLTLGRIHTEIAF